MDGIRDPEGNEAKNLLRFSPMAGKEVLEIGSGAGWLTRQYAGTPRRVCGIEALREELQKAKADQPAGVNNVFTLQAVAEGLPFRASGFDLALLANSL